MDNETRQQRTIEPKPVISILAPFYECTRETVVSIDALRIGRVVDFSWSDFGEINRRYERHNVRCGAGSART